MNQLEPILQELNQMRHRLDLSSCDYHRAIAKVQEMQEAENQHEKEIAEINKGRPVIVQQPVEYKTRLTVRDFEGKPVFEYERPRRQPRPRREAQPLTGQHRLYITLIKAGALVLIVIALCMLRSCGYSLW